MKKNESEPKPQAKKPFFARLLETQELDQVMGGVLQPHDPTDKYPSDTDEHALPNP